MYVQCIFVLLLLQPADAQICNLCNLARHKFVKLLEYDTEMSKHVGVNIYKDILLYIYIYIYICLCISRLK
jgi:hypothetical protein